MGVNEATTAMDTTGTAFEDTPCVSCCTDCNNELQQWQLGLGLGLGIPLILLLISNSIFIFKLRNRLNVKEAKRMSMHPMWKGKKNKAQHANYDNSLTEQTPRDSPFHQANSITNVPVSKPSPKVHTLNPDDPAIARQPTSRELVEADSLASALQIQVPLPNGSRNNVNYVNMSQEDLRNPNVHAGYLDMGGVSKSPGKKPDKYYENL